MDDKPQTFVGLLSDSAVEKVDFRLPAKTRMAITEELGKSETDPVMRGFLDQLESDLGIYAVLDRQRQQQATWKQRVAALRKLSTTTNEMLQQLAGLDAMSYRVLDSLVSSAKGIHGPIVNATDKEGGEPNVMFPRPLEEFRDDLQRLYILLNGMQASFNSNVKPGAKVKKPRRDLIDRIIRAYHAAFGDWPSSTAEHSFERALTLFLESVGIVISDLHSEIVESLARVKGK